MIGWKGKPSAAEEDKPKGFDDYDLRLGDLMRGERATLGKSLLDVQRDLKIKATYIAAIENADVSAFETPGFVSGYVRSYARYLGMDPDRAFAQFCAEANYTPAHGMAPGASSNTIVAARSRASGELRDPFADPNARFVPKGESVLSRIEPAAVGSVAVLIALIAALGYGGWSLLQEVQRVQLAPVEQAPVVAAEIDPLGNVSPVEQVIRSAPEAPAAAEGASEAVAVADPLDLLYRPQALDVPVMTPRDGPIAAIDPENRGPSAAPGLDVAEAATPDPVQVLAESAPPVELLAVRPSWVRVSAADGTVLFEKILEAGESYVVPQFPEPAVLRTGNAGSVYFKVKGQAFGPAGEGASVVSNVALSPEALTQTFAAADPAADPDLATLVNVAEAALPPPAADAP
jgi:cytoskeletal protein RodZ